MYDSTSIQNVQITIKYAKLRLPVTHFCLHVNLGLLAVQKGAHAGVSHRCASRRSSSLWGGQTHEQREERPGVQRSYEWREAGPNRWPRLGFTAGEDQATSTWKGTAWQRLFYPVACRKCKSWAQTAAFSSFFQMYFFSSIVLAAAALCYFVSVLPHGDDYSGVFYI